MADNIDCLAELAIREDIRLDMKLEAGDLQLLCNHTVLHTRAAFEDHDDPKKKRFLLRIWLNIPGGRELLSEFADHYNTGDRQGPAVH